MRKSKNIILMGLIVALVLFLMVSIGLGKSRSKDPWMGVTITDISKRMMKRYDLKSRDGAYLLDIAKDSPADKAGLEDDDIIIKIDDEKIFDTDDLTDAIESHDVGDKVKVTYLRDGKEETATLEFEAEPRRSRSRSFVINNDDDDEDFDFDFDFDFDWDNNDNFIISSGHNYGGYIGVAVQDLNEQLGDYFGVKDGEGALITEVFEDSPAEKAGLEAGDIIQKINGDNIYDTRDVQDFISELDDGDEAEISILRRGKNMEFKVEVTEEKYGRGTITYPGHSGRRIVDLSNFAPRIPRVPAVPRAPRIPSISRLHSGHIYGLDNGDLHDLNYLADNLDELKDEIKYLNKKELAELKSDLIEAQKDMKKEMKDAHYELQDLIEKIDD